MHPIICKIGPLSVYSYGLMLALAVLLCAFFLRKEAKERGYDPDPILDLVFWTVMAGIIGARLFYVALNLGYFIENPLEIIRLQRGGLAFHGGLALGALTAWIFLKKHKMPVAQTLDMVVPYVALGHSIGRIGCFLNGCCYGKEVPWGIYFPVHQARLHPTQLYESLGLLIIFFVLKRFQRVAKRPGEATILYLLLASALRFFNEFFRADHTEIWWTLSIFQIVSLAVFFTALYADVQLKSRSRQ